MTGRHAMLLSLLAVLAAAPAQAAPRWEVRGGVLSVSVTGYMEVCLDGGTLFKPDGKGWTKAATELPHKGLYYLDGAFVGYGACDNVVCSKIEAPARVRLVEYRQTGSKAPPADSGSTSPAVPVYESVPLKGRLRFTLRYFADPDCREARTVDVTGNNPMSNADEAAAPAKVLENAGQFTVGGVGFAGIPSKEELAFRAVLKGEEARAGFLALTSSATTAGRLYGLLGLKLLKDPEFEKRFTAFKASEEPVQSMEGCVVTHKTAGEIATAIEKGKYK